ncbi:MAG: prolipoprotein diacylglyceryl transferase [Elusimicrobia bacterium HGW-Elusimicrobia-1]|jgi:phosphatidylglycerol:prolipoprotein diacylglycerol transferase|nr:MAG: prolipoprotein diacylglyceryl transferase [Elusimicrobia bacterium HGW-Elusimicrobia-1]
MFPTILKAGFLSIRTYGVFLAAAFLLGMRLVVKKTARLGISDDESGKLFLWILPSGIVGARLLYVFIEGGFDAASPLDAFRIWEGGLHYFGGLAGAVAAVAAFSVRHRSFPMWKFADAAGPSLALGLAVGKIGCFFAGCCYGRECSLPWAVVFEHPDSLAIRGLPLHPVQLYEAAVYFLIFAAAESLYRFLPRDVDGESFWFAVFMLSFARFILETLRWEEARWLGVSSGGIAAAVAAIASIGCMVFLRIRARRTGATIGHVAH